MADCTASLTTLTDTPPGQGGGAGVSQGGHSRGTTLSNAHMSLFGFILLGSTEDQKAEIICHAQTTIPESMGNCNRTKVLHEMNSCTSMQAPVTQYSGARSCSVRVLVTTQGSGYHSGFWLPLRVLLMRVQGTAVEIPCLLEYS